MLLRAPVALVKSGAVSRRGAWIAVVMRRFPRYTPKELIDEYVRELAPEEELFAEFKALERASGDHNGAFAAVRYEERFRIGAEGLAHLARLSERARTKDVYLICQCTFDQRCHADLLLLSARHRFQAPISQQPFTYETYAP